MTAEPPDTGRRGSAKGRRAGSAWSFEDRVRTEPANDARAIASDLVEAILGREPGGSPDMQLVRAALQCCENQFTYSLGMAHAEARHVEEARGIDQRSSACAISTSLLRVQLTRTVLEGDGGMDLLRGDAPTELHLTVRRAVGTYVELLASSAEFGLACEFGERVLGETDESMRALARRMDPLFDAACDLQSRLLALPASRDEDGPRR